MASEISGHLRKIYAMLCKWGVNTASGTRRLSTERRDELINMYQPIIESHPPAPLRAGRQPSGVVNCKDAAWTRILNGEMLERPRVLVDVTTGMGGGPELELLELRLLEANASLGMGDNLPPQQDVHVVAESRYGLRGDRKPLHFNNSKGRFGVLLRQVEHIVLDDCRAYLSQVMKMRRLSPQKRGSGGQMYSAEGAQRQCVFATLMARRPDLPDDAVVVFTDLDEIPSAKTLRLLRSCRWHSGVRLPIALAHYPMPFSLRVGCKRKRRPNEMWHQGAVATMGYLRKKKMLHIRYNRRDHLVVHGAGVHMTSMGTRAHVDYKLLHHGEAGQILPLLVAHRRKVKTCEVNDTTLQRLEAQVRDDPASVIRSWEHRSKPLKAAAPEGLEACNVPSALLESPERYPHLWGRPMPAVAAAV